MSEVLVLNPRKRKRSGRKVAKKRRRRSVARRNPANPTRRRRRHVARPRRHTSRRRYTRHNPRMPFGIDLPKILGVSGGLIGTELAGGWLSNMLPATWKADANMANLVRIGSKAAVGVGLPMLLKGMLPRGLGPAIALGGGVAVVVDLFKTYVGPAVGLSDYEYGQLGAYETEAIGALPSADGSSAFSEGAF